MSNHSIYSSQSATLVDLPRSLGTEPVYQSFDIGENNEILPASLPFETDSKPTTSARTIFVSQLLRQQSTSKTDSQPKEQRKTETPMVERCRLFPLLRRRDVNSVSYSQTLSRAESNRWLSSQPQYDNQHHEHIHDSASYHQTSSVNQQISRSVFLTDLLKTKAQILRQKFIHSTHLLGHHFREDYDQSDWTTPVPNEFDLPRFNHIRESLAQHRYIPGPNLPSPPSESELFELAKNHNIDVKVLERWIHRGVRCWVSFHFQLNDESVNHLSHNRSPQLAWKKQRTRHSSEQPQINHSYHNQSTSFQSRCSNPTPVQCPEIKPPEFANPSLYRFDLLHSRAGFTTDHLQSPNFTNGNTKSRTLQPTKDETFCANRFHGNPLNHCSYCSDPSLQSDIPITGLNHTGLFQSIPVSNTSPIIGSTPRPASLQSLEPNIMSSSITDESSLKSQPTHETCAVLSTITTQPECSLLCTPAHSQLEQRHLESNSQRNQNSSLTTSKSSSEFDVPLPSSCSSSFTTTSSFCLNSVPNKLTFHSPILPSSLDTILSSDIGRQIIQKDEILSKTSPTTPFYERSISTLRNSNIELSASGITPKVESCLDMNQINKHRDNEFIIDLKETNSIDQPISAMIQPRLPEKTPELRLTNLYPTGLSNERMNKPIIPAPNNEPCEQKRSLYDRAFHLYRMTRAIRGGARRWDEWNCCWIARRYSLVLHCSTGSILLSLDLPEEQLLAKQQQHQNKRLSKDQNSSNVMDGEIISKGIGKQQGTRDSSSRPQSESQEAPVEMMYGESNKISPSIEKRETTLKALKLNHLESSEQVVNLEDLAHRSDVIGGLACIGMAIDISKRLDGGRLERRKKAKVKMSERIWKKITRRQKKLVQGEKDPYISNSCIPGWYFLRKAPQHYTENGKMSAIDMRYQRKASPVRFGFADLYESLLPTDQSEQDDNPNESIKSYYIARNNLQLNSSHNNHHSYRHIVILRFRGSSHCLVTVFDCESDSDEFFSIIHLLKDFRTI